MVLDSLAASRNCSRPSGFKSSLNSVHLIDPPCGNSTTRSKAGRTLVYCARQCKPYFQANFPAKFRPGLAYKPHHRQWCRPSRHTRSRSGQSHPSDLSYPSDLRSGCRQTAGAAEKAGRQRDRREKAQKLAREEVDRINAP